MTFQVITLLCVLILLSFPPGYLLLSIALRKTSREKILPFVILLPLYLSVGISIQVLFCLLIGVVIISQIVPVAIAFVSTLILVIFHKHFRFEKFHYRLKSPRAREVFVIAATLFLFISITIYFSSIASRYQWPPVGDAIVHSAIVSLLIHNGEVGTDLMPLDDSTFPYPRGFHVLAAEISLLSGIYPAESVFIFGDFLTILLSLSLFTLSYSFTRSFWLSLPIPFSIIIVHSSQHLGRWLGGFIYNGPYPNLFGFVAVISIATLCHILYTGKIGFWKGSTTLIVIILALLVTYPSFLFHSLIIITVYLIASSLFLRRISKESRTVTIHGFYSSILSLSKKIPNLAHHYYNIIFRLIENRIILLLNISIIGSFLLVFFLGGLLQFYYELLTYFPSQFAQNVGDKSWLNPELIWKEFNSDIYYKTLPALAIVSSFVLFILKKKIIPFFIAWLILLVSVLAGINFIVPLRTLTFIATLSWVIVGYSVSQFLPTGSSNYKIKDFIIIAAFVSPISIMILYYGIYLNTNTVGWFLSVTTNFSNSYDAAEWLVRHAGVKDLILNDRTYASSYLHGFSLLNLSNHYFNAYPDEIHENQGPQDVMPKELNQIWKYPRNETLVHDLLKKYDVRFIILLEGGGTDYINWGGDGRFHATDNKRYKNNFQQYDFIKLMYQKGNSFVFAVDLS